MTISEFSDQFDVLYNNVTSNQAPGLDEYEKSLFLTKAEKEIVKNYFSPNSKGNNLGQGFDDSAKRQADFSVLMKTAYCSYVPELIECVQDGTSTSTEVDAKTLILTDRNGNNVSWGSIPTDVVLSVDLDDEAGRLFVFGTGEYSYIDYFIDGFPYASGELQKKSQDNHAKLDPRSGVYSFPSDTFIVINEALYTINNKILQVVPLRYDEYTRLMSKPFKRPLKNQAWRLMNSGMVADDDSADKGTSTKYVEIVTNSWDKIGAYNIRYVRVPKPIIVAPLDAGLSIDGVSEQSDKCEIDPILHEDILQRAVELAKIAWTATGQDNVQLEMTAGQRSE